MDYGEMRRRIIGLGNGRFLTLIYTERRDDPSNLCTKIDVLGASGV